MESKTTDKGDYYISNLITLPSATATTLVQATFLSYQDHHNHFSIGPLNSSLVPYTAVTPILDPFSLLCLTSHWASITLRPNPDSYHGLPDIPAESYDCPALQTHSLPSSLCSEHVSDLTASLLFLVHTQHAPILGTWQSPISLHGSLPSATWASSSIPMKSLSIRLPLHFFS